MRASKVENNLSRHSWNFQSLHFVRKSINQQQSGKNRKNAVKSSCCHSFQQSNKPKETSCCLRCAFSGYRASHLARRATTATPFFTQISWSTMCELKHSAQDHILCYAFFSVKTNSRQFSGGEDEANGDFYKALTM